MNDLTAEERSTLSRFLADSRGRTEFFFQYMIYFVPSLVFGLYGIWKADLVAVTIAYFVLFELVVYLLQRQGRSNPTSRSAIRKLLDQDGVEGIAAPGPPADFTIQPIG